MALKTFLKDSTVIVLKKFSVMVLKRLYTNGIKTV